MLEKARRIASTWDPELATWSGKKVSQQSRPCVPGIYDYANLWDLGLHRKLSDNSKFSGTDAKIEKAIEKALGDIADGHNIQEQIRAYVSAAKAKEDTGIVSTELGKVSKSLFGDPRYVFNTGNLFKNFYRGSRGNMNQTIPLADLKKLLHEINFIYLQEKDKVQQVASEPLPFQEP